jgi:hypothetical protein
MTISAGRERRAPSRRYGAKQASGGGEMAASWIVVRVMDQTIVGQYPTRREAAEKAFQFSRKDRHVAIRNLGAGWPKLKQDSDVAALPA